MLVVVQRGERGNLCEQIGVERLPDFFQRRDELGIANAVADAQAGESVDLRERPHQNQIGPHARTHQRRQVKRLVQKFDVSLVHHQQHIVGNFVDEMNHLFARRERAGGIIRVCHEHDARLRRDGFEHRGQIVSVFFRRNRDDVRTEHFGDDGINRETELRHHHVVAGHEQRVRDELDDFVRAVAEDEIRRFDAEFGREFLFQVKRVAVGIKIHAGDGFLQRGDGERRRSERIFVRRDLDDRVGGQAKFARDFFNRSSRLIRRQKI